MTTMTHVKMYLGIFREFLLGFSETGRQTVAVYHTPTGKYEKYQNCKAPESTPVTSQAVLIQAGKAPFNSFFIHLDSLY